MASKPVIPQNDNVAHALAGAGGGILSMVLTYPLITLSTRAQVESRRAETAFLTAVRRIVAQEGVAGLYAGLDSAVFGISVTNFVYYYWYEWTRAAFQKRASAAGRGGAGRVASTIKLTTIESILAGALAGSATVIMTNPIWVVNTRMTTRAARAQSDANTKDATLIEGEKKKLEEGEEEAAAAKAESKEEEKKPTGKKPTTISTLLALLRAEGPQALFRGVVPALVLVINPILQYTLFEQMKNLVEKRQRAATGQKTARITPTMAFLLGALGKLFATGVTYPYITVKSRMHVADAAAPGEGKKAEGVTGALGRVVREEGWGGLYKGIGPKITQSVLTAAFLFAFKDVLYEQTVRLRGKVAARKTI